MVSCKGHDLSSIVFSILALFSRRQVISILGCQYLKSLWAVYFMHSIMWTLKTQGSFRDLIVQHINWILSTYSLRQDCLFCFVFKQRSDLVWLDGRAANAVPSFSYFGTSFSSSVPKEVLQLPPAKEEQSLPSIICLFAVGLQSSPFLALLYILGVLESAHYICQVPLIFGFSRHSYYWEPKQEIRKWE